MITVPRSVRYLLALTLTLACPAAFSQEPSLASTERASAATKDVAARQAETISDIHEITLENGLRIFVQERRSSPTFAAIYQFGVGGAMDPKGKSGIAHLLEHMLFKGTDRIGVTDPEKEAEVMARITELWHQLHVELDRRDNPFEAADEDEIARLEKEIEKASAEHKKLIIKNEYDEIISRAGGVSLNAGTGNDSTIYFLQLPANRLELWFQLESARLLHPVFREFYSERDVVQEERRLRTDNRPSGKMREALQNLMYAAHPYGTPVVGWPRDLERLTREDAMAYFRTYYSPSNCIMGLVGDVDVAEVRQLAQKYFGPWKRQDLPRLPVTTELEQQGERRGVVELNAEPQIMMGWPTVAEGQSDQYALDILSSVLGGLASSRLDKTIVQQERLVANVYTFHRAQKYGGSFIAGATLLEGRTAAEVEAAIERELARIAEEGVTPEELERARVRNEAGRVAQLKSNIGQAFWIVNAVDVSGGIDYMERYTELLDAVTTDDVRAVAARYLRPSRKNVVELHKNEDAATPSGRGSGVTHQRGAQPGGRGTVHSVGFTENMERIRKAEPVSLTVPEIGKDVTRIELESGVTVFLKEDPSAPSIEMMMTWLGGSNTAPLEDLAAFELADSLLAQGGTEQLNPIALQEKKDELGLRLILSMGSTRSQVYFWSLSRNFDEAFELVTDILMKPRFDASRLETIRGQYVERMRRRIENPGAAARQVQDQVLNAEHPRLGFVAPRAAIEAVKPEDVRRLWRRYLGKDNLYVTVVGDFEKEAMLKRLEQRFAAWQDAEDPARDFLARKPPVRPGVFVVEKPLPQPAVRLSHYIAVDRTVPLAEHAAIEVMNDILGGSGFQSRLMERLRSDEGLTYGIRSSISHEERPGVPGRLDISYQTKRESVAHSVSSVLEEIHKIIAEEVTEAEVEEQIDSWRNRFIFSFTNAFSSVSRLMRHEVEERPYDYEEELLAAVQKVKVTDVQRVAQRYLKPENLTISIFGTLTEEDRKAFETDPGLTVLPREEVFRGGYGEAGKPEMSSPSSASRAVGSHNP